MPFAATWIDLEIIILSEVSQTEKDKYHMISLICRILKKNDTHELIKQKQTHRLRKQTYGYQKGKMLGEEIDWEFGIDRYPLLYLVMTNRDLLYSTGNSA